jgi:hypothetical protein
MVHAHATSDSAPGRTLGLPIDQQPCPLCETGGALRRFARSDWYLCHVCRRTLLFRDARLARLGIVGEPWHTVVGLLVIVAVLACSSIASAEMPRVSVRVRTCVKDTCSRATTSFARSASRHVAELQVARHADNRRLIVTLYCDGLLVDGPAEIPHEGEAAFPIRTREYRALPPGRYVANVVLLTASGEEVRAAPAEFTVIDGVP